MSKFAARVIADEKQQQRSTLTRINEQLKRQSIPYQLVRGRGYYYLRMLEGAPILPSDSIYQYRIEPSDYPAISEEVRVMLAAGGIKAKFD